MKATCSSKCQWYKKYKKGERCPFYMETIWTPTEGDGTPVVIKDCAPKRSVLLTMELSNRLLGLQASSEQERNKQHRVLEKLVKISQTQIPDAEYKMLD